MNNVYNNIPNTKIPNSSDATLQAFDAYFIAPLELKVSTFDAIKSFFTGRGFDISAAESITVIIMKQAKQDRYNPMQVLDSLKGLDSVELTSLIAEILNYNRFKSSYLGYALEFIPYEEVLRNIAP